MYTVRGHGEMIRDAIRVGRYVEALRRVVKPGSIVLDIGTGTGILAVAACRFGARRVFAVEPGDVIELAREVAAANGVAGRIEFIQGYSTAVELDTRADVIVADLHGILPFFEKGIATWIDARERLLAPGGTLVPRRETIWAAVVEAPTLHDEIVSPWNGAAQGIDLDAGRVHATSEMYRERFAAEDLLTQPARWAELDYATVEDVNASGSLRVRVERDGTAHGIALWFDAVLAEGVEMSNAPGNPPVIFGHAYLPWPEAVGLRQGDTVEIDLRARQLGDGYLWRWESRVVSDGRERAAFQQSQFDAVILVPDKLRRQAATHVPRLNEQGEIEKLVLERMSQATPLGDIARELRKLFPGRFARWEDALNHVGDLALRCSD
jgi:protein arginine N-methyltransferase 1